MDQLDPAQCELKDLKQTESFPRRASDFPGGFKSTPKNVIVASPSRANRSLHLRLIDVVGVHDGSEGKLRVGKTG